jgi:ribonuclease-3
MFHRKERLVQAFVHRSYVNEKRETGLESNERLEFLGDAVLNFLVADYLYHRLPGHPEGQLSQLRSRLVDAASCAGYLQQLGVAEYILLGRGEMMSEGRGKGSILADAFEAIVGAIYLDSNIQSVRQFLLWHFEEKFNSAVGTPARNFKAELQDYSQRKFQKTPVYKVVEETGPDHSKQFHVVVSVNDQEVGMGMGRSKKEAEQRAAFEAIGRLEQSGAIR